MRKVLVLLCFFFVGCNQAQAIPNVATTGTAVISIASGTKTGTEASVNDENYATYVQVDKAHPLVANVDYSLTITFDDFYDVKETEIKHALAGFETFTVNTYALQLYYAGSWHNILTKGAGFGVVTESVLGTWSSVLAVRLLVDVTGGKSTPSGSGYALSQLYEIKVFGSKSGNYIISLL